MQLIAPSQSYANYGGGSLAYQYVVSLVATYFILYEVLTQLHTLKKVLSVSKISLLSLEPQKHGSATCVMPITFIRYTGVQFSCVGSSVNQLVMTLFWQKTFDIKVSENLFFVICFCILFHPKMTLIWIWPYDHGCWLFFDPEGSK